MKKFNKKRKFLYIANSHEIGGGNRSLLTIVEYILKSKNWEPIVFVPAPGRMSEELERRKILHRVVPHHVVGKSTFALIRHYILYFIEVVKVWPVLIHANDLFCYRPVGFFANLLKIPVVCHMRFSVESTSINYFLKPLPDVLIFNSNFMLQEFLLNCKHICPNLRKEVIYNGFTSEEYFKENKRLEVRASWGIKDEFVVGILGNFAPVKDHELFIEAAKILLSQKTNFRFVIIGDDILENGRRKDDLKQMASAFGLGDRIYFAGFEPIPARALAGMDVLVVPSRFESFGRVAVEGLLSGVPVVASRTGGLQEILDGVPGSFLVTPGKVGEFVSAILDVFEGRRDKIGEAREITINRFDRNVCIAQLVELYSALVD